MSKIEKILEMLKTNAGDSFLQHALALEYIKIGQYAEAQSLFESVLSADPTYVGSYYHLAKLIERSGDYDLAISWYDKGLEASKAAGDKHAYNELLMAKEEITED